MSDIQMVDLKGQYQHIQAEIDQAVLNVIRSSAYINGPEVKDFQKELESYLGVKHVIPCANGTDALQVAMMALDLQPGDEVITPNFTFIATVEVIALLGLKPVIVEVDPHTFNMDPEAVRAAITPNTKVIAPVHLFGQCANMEEIMGIAKENNLHIIEDTAQAISSDYTFSNGETHRAGTMGHFGTTSFFPSKNLGCYGDGGALYTNDDQLAEKARQVANHGMKVRYYHDFVGVNSRLDSIQAAILRIKLRHLDTYCAARIAAADYYDAAFANIPELTTPVRDAKSSHTFHQYTLKTQDLDRDALQQHLKSKGIPAMIYYPVPLHVQNAFSNLGHQKGDFPITEQLCKEVISLPMHTELTEEQLKLITSSVIEYIEQQL
ncbi:MAG: DegT/DnrJ/EryC1/StrS family aminotransferase [Flavobacteriales bacterium]|nr:DegT/DnrJ/EryC1/StrS family aminotransferase [Flavobacteriales bacterium]MDG1779382.1 DegT/DnrJ/EryC1/StrS family aminotransferase [Flavobacteriales bacterium]MDG2245151.1 DegT/DnrJ/EryC1/StrS family aminotransferase [Flavobacteriales bacterium]